MRLVQDCYQQKVTTVLDEIGSGRAILIFNHGLGDFCLFMPLFDALRREYPKWDLYVGFIENRGYLIHEKAIVVEPPYGNLSNQFDALFGIQYPEPPRDPKQMRYWIGRNIPNLDKISKPYLCNITEIGLKNFVWTQFRYDVDVQKKKRIGVHFNGYTSALKKDCLYDDAKLIWQEIKAMGFEPFEIQMIPTYVENCERYDFIGQNTLRGMKPDVRRMALEIAKCQYFIGVDSGPLFLAGSVLGFENCIALERERKLNKVLPFPISKINISNYRETSTLIEIYKKEKENERLSGMQIHGSD